MSAQNKAALRMFLRDLIFDSLEDASINSLVLMAQTAAVVARRPKALNLLLPRR